MGPCAVKSHKITALSCCKLTSEVHKTWRKHCPVNIEAGRWGVQLPFNCLHLQTVHFEMFTSHHFSFSLTYLCYLILCVAESPWFFLKAAGILDHACIFPNKFPGAVGHLSAVTKQKKNEMSEDVSYPQTPGSVSETMFRWLQFFTALLTCYHLSVLLAP